MKIEEEKPENLKTQLNKTKRIMQIVTLTVVVVTIFLIYGWITNSESVSGSYSMIIIALVFVIIMLDKKYKKIKAELELRK